jgi:hypothetical protein
LIASIISKWHGDGILEAGQRRLAGQPGRVGGAVGDKFEDRIGAQAVVVVLVLVAGQDAINAGADHLQEGVLGEVGVARVIER